MSFENLTETHEPKGGAVFLDTSVHCARHKGASMKGKIQQFLRLFHWKTTSSYTQMEYGNVVLTKAYYCLQLLDRYNDLDDVLTHVANALVGQFHNQHRTWAMITNLNNIA